MVGVKGRILVVDDEPDVRLVARVILTSAGYEVVEAESGEDALGRLASEPVPDVILLDVRMRGLSGWDVLRRLRQNPDHAHVPVVVFTAQMFARDDAPDEWRDYEHFITKPFKPDELLGAVESAMGD